MKRTFDITGMTCAACSARVEKAARGVDGVRDVAVNLLKNNMASLNRVAEFLYREETITGEQFMSLLRGLPEPGETSADAQA